jgi:uncharacterized spore protein YtfJ
MNRYLEEARDMDIGDLLAKTAEDISVRRAFGTAYEKDGMLIIPVALVARGGGAGTARARRGNSVAGPDDAPKADTTADDATPQDSVPPDVGGGFGGLVLPSGVYVVRGDQVRWVPVVDARIVALAAVGLARVLARTRSRRRRPRHR